MLDRYLAYATPHGVDYQAECPTTHELFVGRAKKAGTVAGRPSVWLLCPCCDAELHTGEDCDPCSPQFHLYLVEGA